MTPLRWSFVFEKLMALEYGKNIFSLAPNYIKLAM